MLRRDAMLHWLLLRETLDPQWTWTSDAAAGLKCYGTGRYRRGWTIDAMMTLAGAAAAVAH